MNKEKLKEILQIILDRLGDKRISWRLDGSANLLAQGISTDVNDLDIVTNEEGMNAFQEALKEFILQEYRSEELQAQTIEIELEGEDVEVHFYDDEKFQMLDKTKKVKWDGLELPCLPLEDAKKFYEMINRSEKVRLIEDNLKR